MHIESIQTDIFKISGDLESFVIEHAGDKIKENTILAITSKIVSLSESRTAPASTPKEQLVRQEADQFLGEIGYGCFLTIKEGLLIASAGVDESNSDSGDYILFPINPQKTCEILCNNIKSRLKLKNFGLIFTDSKTLPLRRGVIGACLSYAGFRAIKPMVGKKDLFGRTLEMTNINAADALAASATYLMGEGSERRPLAIIYSSGVEFSDQTRPSELKIPVKEDLYAPLLQGSFIK